MKTNSKQKPDTFSKPDTFWPAGEFDDVKGILTLKIDKIIWKFCSECGDKV